MRAIRALFVILATLLVLAVLAAWLAPRFLDWNRYRDDISRLAAGVLDRPVLMEGPVTLRLLPHPVLTASGVRVGGEPDEGTFSARELSLGLAIAPLLGGRIEARELLLHGVDLQLPWPLPENALPLRRPAWLAGISARIEGGRAVIGGVEVDGIDATFASSGSGGGFQMAGTARLYGHSWRVAAHLGVAGADNAVPLDLRVGGEGLLNGTEATFSGQVSAEGAGGRLTARGPDLAQLIPAPKLPFSASGRLTAAAGLAAADDLALVIGGAPAHGALSLRITPSLRVDLALAASRLDVDAWLPVLLKNRAGSYPVGLDLSAEAAQLAGGQVRRLRAAWELDGGQVELREASAILPGEANLQLSGRIAPGPAGRGTELPAPPSFEGKVALAAPDLRATLQWLDPAGRTALQALPPGVFRSLDLSAEARLETDRLALTRLAGSLDGSRVTGSAALGLGVLRGQPFSQLRADLSVDRLDLDAWLPAEPPTAGDLAHLLRLSDADVRLRCTRATIQGVAITGLVLDGAATYGRLAIRHFEAKGLGLQANASGSVDASGRVSSARLAFTTEDASPIGEWLAPFWRATPAFWHAPVLAWVEADGPSGALNVTARLRLADSDLGMKAELALPGAGSASVSLRNPDAPRLLRDAGVAGLASSVGEGPLAAEMHLGVAPDHIAADRIDFAAGTLRVLGQLSIDRTKQQPWVVGELAAGALPLPPLELRSPDPLPLQVLRGWQGRVQVAANRVLAGRTVLEEAAGTVILNAGKLALQNLQAKLWDGSISGAASLNAAAEPPVLNLEARLSGATIRGPLTGLPLDIVAGRADGDAEVSASGHSPAAMLATLDGRMRVAITDGTVAGSDLAALNKALGSATGESALDAALSAALAAGRTRFGKLELAASAKRGIVDVAGSSLGTQDGSMAWSGTIDLPDSILDLHAAIRPSFPDAPQVGLRISGPVAAPRYLPELADVIRWRVQHVHAP